MGTSTNSMLNYFFCVAAFFFLTYLLDLGLHFYYLKNNHLNKMHPRLVLTLLRIVGLTILGWMK